MGIVGLDDPHPAWGTAEVGYFVDPDHWGNGYATDAVRTVCRYAFGERRLGKLYGHVFETNPASARVMEKVGFVREGVHRGQAFLDGERVDILRYGLLADELDEGNRATARAPDRG